MRSCMSDPPHSAFFLSHCSSRRSFLSLALSRFCLRKTRALVGNLSCSSPSSASFLPDSPPRRSSPMSWSAAAAVLKPKLVFPEASFQLLACFVHLFPRSQMVRARLFCSRFCSRSQSLAIHRSLPRLFLLQTPSSGILSCRLLMQLPPRHPRLRMQLPAHHRFLGTQLPSHHQCTIPLLLHLLARVHDHRTPLTSLLY